MGFQFDLKHVTFRCAQERDILKIQNWLLKERIKDYWGDGGLTLPDLRQFVQTKPSIFSHIIGLYFDKPIAFFMTSILEKEHDWKKWMDPGQLSLSFDFMIGEDEFIGRGLAHLLVEEFIKQEETSEIFEKFKKIVSKSKLLNFLITSLV